MGLEGTMDYLVFHARFRLSRRLLWSLVGFQKICLDFEKNWFGIFRVYKYVAHFLFRPLKEGGGGGGGGGGGCVFGCFIFFPRKIE